MTMGAEAAPPVPPPSFRDTARGPGRWAGRLRAALFWGACFALPIAVLAAVAAWGRVYPFGPESFLTEDLKYQYIDFFAWFRRVLTGDANLLYSFSQAMGSGTWGLYGYYLASPFNVVVLLFDEAHLTLAVFVIVALKLGCVQLSATWYVRRRFSLPAPWAALLGLCFTWSTWMATDLRNPLWLDALILLPLAAWRVCRLVRDGSVLPLAALIAASIVVCWYTAYITMLFLVLIAALELVCAPRAPGPRRPVRLWARAAARLAAAYALGVALSAWTFVPSCLAMMGGPASSALGSPFRCLPANLIRGFLPGGWTPNNVPQFYAGIVALLGSLAFLVNRRVARRTRVLTLLLAALLVSSSVLSLLEYVWCGMRPPTGFYSRTAFLLTFMELWATAQGLAAAPRPCARRTRTLMRVAPVALIGLTCVELAWNAHVAWDQLYVGYPQSAHDAYVTAAADQLKRLRDLDGSAFYRVEKTYTRVGASLNEGLAQRFDQLSSYSSATSLRAVSFLNRLGYSSEGEFSTCYASTNLVMDSLLGVKYVSTTGIPAGFAPTGLAPAEGSAAAFMKNPYALSLGLVVGGSARDTAAPVGGDPFERQNALLSSISGDDTAIFHRIEGGEISRSETSASWSVEIPAGSIGYAYVIRGTGANRYQPIRFQINGGPPVDEGWRFSNNVRGLGPVSAAPSTCTVTLTAQSGANDLSKGTVCVFYALDMDAFESRIAQLREGQFEPSVFEDGHVRGTYDSARAGDLLLSVPYDRGWDVTVNNRSAAFAPAFGGGMSVVAVEAGANEIEMTYHAPGLALGLSISAVTALAIAGWRVRAYARCTRR